MITEGTTLLHQWVRWFDQKQDRECKGRVVGAGYRARKVGPEAQLLEPVLLVELFKEDDPLSDDTILALPANILQEEEG